MKKYLVLCFTFLFGFSTAQSVWAIEYALSAFGTLGYAISDQPFAYQRFIDDGGTWMRDSILGVQADISFDEQWGATVQAKLAAAEDNDDNWEPSVSWAFISWRPDNDLLLRAGKVRLPYLFNSENTDVGATFDFARMPAEVLLIANDIYGINFSKTWAIDSKELVLEGYVGQKDFDLRFYGRDRTLSSMEPGAIYLETEIKGGGLTLTLNDDENRYRAGVHQLRAKRTDGGGILSDIAFIPLPSPPYSPGLGMYDPDLSYSPTVDSIDITVITLSAEIALPHDFRIISELVDFRVDEVDIGLDRWGGYLAVLKPIDAWTPYVYYAITKSSDTSIALFNAVNNHRIPATEPNAALINASQRSTADSLVPIDQNSWAIGTSYRLTPKSLIKAEWVYTTTGDASSFIDAPAGGESGRQHINSFSLSYNFTF